MRSITDNLTRIFNRYSTKALSHITGAIDNSLGTISSDLKLLDLEYIIGTSTGDWLDEWGSWFGVPRMINESDENYRNRILAVCTKPKSTIPALESTAKAYLGDDNAKVIVYEPYTNIFRYSISNWSGKDVYQDGYYYRSGVVDINIGANITDPLKEVLNNAKGAGVKIFYTKLDELHMLIGAPLHQPTVASELFIEMMVHNTSGGYLFDVSSNLPLSGGKVLWIGDTDRFSDLKEAIFTVPKTQYSAEQESVSLYKVLMGCNDLMSEGYGAVSGYKLSPYDLSHPLPFREKPLSFSAQNHVSLDITNRSIEKILSTEIVVNTESQRSMFSEYIGGPISGHRTLWAEKEVSTDLSAVISSRFITVSCTGWKGFQTIEDVSDMTIEEMDSIVDRTTNPIECSITELV